MVLVPLEGSVRLAEIMSSSLSALRGHDNPLGLGRVNKAAVMVVDGMGAGNLREVAGHARWLSSRWAKRALTADAGFPSTTASALTTLTTGVGPGQHGIVGYTVLDPDSRTLINHLGNWRPHVQPESWQRQPTLFEVAAQEGIASLSLGEPRFLATDFTAATWRGATFQGVGTLDEQLTAVRDFFDANERALAYMYWSSLDRIGHSSGSKSDSWIHRLEEFDQWCAGVESSLRGDEAMLITADHGMVDIPQETKMVVEEDSPLLTGVSAWGGEPRAAQLYLSRGDATEDVASAWRESLGPLAQVLTKTQAIDEGLFGPVHPDVVSRIGDVIIACEGNSAVYRGAHATSSSLAMIGQHGSITPREREVPVIPLGVWS